ncbi:putative RNase H-like HicB family nuclease [Paenibacillus mucilaginosus]|uniref:type II toxin-antitoxin system HicB family antitoxin n=1 Tax=Paenibacillus mucilaginosus TaxID=61624 RepID=UPI003D1A5FDA
MPIRDNYVYPAIFHYAADGISVEFPDLPGALTCGDTYEEAFDMAMDCLALHLYEMETDRDDIPAPTPYAAIMPAENETVQLIHVWLPLSREYQRMKRRESS